MIKRSSERLLLLFLACNLALGICLQTGPLRAAEPDSQPAQSTDTSEKSRKEFHPVSPGPADGTIAYVTAKILEKYHYLKKPFTAEVSSKFLDRYLETLDPQHSLFLQTDLADFERYRTNLDRLTVVDRRVADTRPACEIFNRFVQRFQDRTDYVDQLLKTEKFTFDDDQKIVLNRHELPYPKDMNEARQLWRERLRFEYLQEKLGKADARKKTAKNEKPEAPAGKAGEAKPKKTDAEDIVDTLSHRYHRTLHTFIDWDNDDVLQIYLDALTHVYDPHSDYFGHSQLESFAIGMNLSLFGIGAELTSEDGYCTINRLLAGGPAEKSKKIHVRDRVVAVAQSNQPPVDVVDMSLNKAVSLIRGPKGSEVTLTILPAGENSTERTTLKLVRDEIKLEDAEAKAKIIETPKNNGGTLRLGVIDLPSFYATFPIDAGSGHARTEPKSTTADVSRLLTKLKKENVNGVILDLRHNGGGSLEEAIRLTGLFIKEGPVVQVKGFDGSVQVDEDNDPSMLYDGPLVVLTSRLSASASEIVAGALQDYGRALIVGDSSTHGKGTVQSVQGLKDVLQLSHLVTNDPGAVKLTIKKFYRASGASTQRAGVVPDIVLPSVLNDNKDIGETALENPLPYDTIPSAKFDRMNLVEPVLPELRSRSIQRVAADKDFEYIREDIAYYKKQQADKTISLNEKQRVKEKEDIDARIKAREQERRARKESADKVYEISLKQALENGLPAPVAKTNNLQASVERRGTPPTLSNGATASNTTKDAASAKDSDDAIDEEKAPAVDATLMEAEHILIDYLSVFPKANLVTVKP